MVSSALRRQTTSSRRSRRRQFARVQGLADLDRCDPDSASGAEHEQRLSGGKRCAVTQRVVGSAVGQDEGRAFLEAHLRGKPREPGRLHLRFLGERAVGGEGHDAIARPPRAHAFAHLLDHAGELAPRRERQRRLELVLVR
jgi:hypothetical protein